MRLIVASLALSWPRIADACGGLFCGAVSTPVLQAEEAIIFDVDPEANRVTAMINIVYQGAPADFAWVLPLQTEPERIDLGSQQAFATLQAWTTPRFTITGSTNEGECADPRTRRSSSDDDGDNAPAPAPAPPDVLRRETVGPYDTVVLQGEPAAVKDWLIANAFRVTDEMMDLVIPYIAQGDTLLALKLLNDQSAGEIRPIEVVMRADFADRVLEACIPIRMTAMAANTDMPIVAYFFSDLGRAYPKNFYHVIPNLVQINWLTGGSNYRQVIANAVDEADAGHAFVTEFSGPPSFLANRVDPASGFNAENLRSHTDLCMFLEVLINANMLQRLGMQAVLERRFPPVKACPFCGPSTFRGVLIDPNPAVDDMLAEIIEPDRRAQSIMDSRAWLTRLFTMLDPEEMTIDPFFDFNAGLGPVSRGHAASVIQHCSPGDVPGSGGGEVVLEDGRRIFYDPRLVRDYALINSMPAAERVEQLEQGVVVNDNTARIDELLQQHNQRVLDGIAARGCGCSASSVGDSSGLFAILLLTALRLTRRERAVTRTS